LKQYLDKIFFNKSFKYQSRIIGIILFITGFIFLYYPSEINLKISTSLLFISFIIFLLINEQMTPNKINDFQITIIIIAWILIILVITRNTEFDVFFILIIIGIIALKELLYEFLNQHLQKRFSVLFYILIILFVIIIIKRIINISIMYPS
jgi:hypothetical protein